MINGKHFEIITGYIWVTKAGRKCVHCIDIGGSFLVGPAVVIASSQFVVLLETAGPGGLGLRPGTGGHRIVGCTGKQCGMSLLLLVICYYIMCNL